MTTNYLHKQAFLTNSLNRRFSIHWGSGYWGQWLVVLALVITTAARGQSPLGQHPLRQSPLRFEHLGTAQGLSHNKLYCVYQDREGFMWFGTDDGLDRYDGYTFTVYKPDPADPNNHMAHNTIWDIVESRSGEIWFVTPGGGLHRLNKQTGRVNFFRVERDGSDRFAPYDICYTIMEDKQGFLWIGSEGGLARFDPRTKQYRLYNIPVAQGNDDRVWSIQEDRFGTLWVGTSTGLFTMNRRTGQFSPFHFGPDPAEKQPRIESMYLATDNSLWIATFNKGLYRLLPGKGSVPGQNKAGTTYASTGRVYLTNMEILPHGLAEDEHRNLMAGTKWGLVQLNPITGSYVTYHQDPNVAGSLSHNVVWALLADNRGTFWIGTQNGIDRYSPLTPRFAFYQPIPDHNATPRVENNIALLSTDPRGNIWFSNATRPYIGNVFLLNLSDHQTYVSHTSQPLAPGLLASKISVVYSPTDLIATIHCDRGGRLWMATPSGLQSRDANGQFRQYPVSFPITSIDEDKQGIGPPKRLWVGGHSKLARFDPATGAYTFYRIDENNPIGKGGGQVNDILVSRTGDVWVSVGGVGACKLDPRTGQLINYHPHPVGNQKIFYSRDVTAICETNDGAIWVSTNIGGVFRIDPKTAAVSTFTIHDGLPDNHIVSLVTDPAGMLWMATGGKLCRLDPVTRKLRVFDEHDGLLSQGFTGSCTRTPTGELAFGCTNGIVVFRPSEMGGNPYKPPVYITQVRMLDSTRLFPQSPLTLAYRENVISFNFGGLNYIAPEKNQYAYKLEGVNSEWIYCGAQRTATYSFLAPGTYVFRVKASNNDGVWNEMGASIQLVILPPWWRTYWAYVLYMLLLAGSIWAFIAYRSRVLRRENRLLEEKVASRTHEVREQKAEIEAQRDQLRNTLSELQITQDRLIQKEKLASLGELTAGIAHEIQNPLNFVNNYSDLSAKLIQQLSSKPALAGSEPITDDTSSRLFTTLAKNLQKISHHGERASAIVKSMLAHARTSAGEHRPTNLNALVEEYLKLAYHGQRTKDSTFNCQLVTEFDPRIGSMVVAPQEIGQVLLNVLANAFYAMQQRQASPFVGTDLTASQGAVYQPVIQVSTRRTGQMVEIRVTDNGIGIPDTIKDKLFQPFYTTKPMGEGTGLGLSLSHDIIAKGHGGTLTIDSREGENTSFLICLPVIESSPGFVKPN